MGGWRIEGVGNTPSPASPGFPASGEAAAEQLCHDASPFMEKLAAATEGVSARDHSTPLAALQSDHPQLAPARPD
jgi:hypothetical protein